MTLSTTAAKNFARTVRRSQQHRKATIDTNADFNGRRSTGDPRLDLAAVDRYFRV